MCCICRWDEEDVVLNIFVSLYIKYVVSVVVRVGMCERENPCGTQKVFFLKIGENSWVTVYFLSECRENG